MAQLDFPRDMFLGFDHIFDGLNNVHGNNTYPPYNIIKNNNSIFIELAVAGFNESDIKITLEKNNLNIKGSKPAESKDVESFSYVHKGISSRDFQHNFTIADTMVVKGADMRDGMLIVRLDDVIPEEDLPQIISIGTNNQLLTEEAEA